MGCHMPSLAKATSIDMLIAGQEQLHEEVTVPPEAVQDKVFFIFNNLSIANMDVKAKELMDSVEEKMMPWVAQYLVMKRASIEHNFHTLYAKFIDHLNKHDFTSIVVDETFRNIRVLLRSDKGPAKFSDRSLLKNLGHWLGMLTLAKHIPILHQDLDLKSLLYEAFHKGAQELLYVVPFVAKVLESCAQSKVFKLPNPWTLSLMNVLAELHQVQDLKLNLKFEIEVLCKNLIIDINDLEPKGYLADEERLTYLENQLSAPRKGPDSSTPQPEEPLQINMPTPTTTVVTSTPTQTSTTTATATTTSIVPPSSHFSYNDINIMSFAGLGPHITINESNLLLQVHPHLKQLIGPAVEKAVQELLKGAVERSIMIAATTCEQIVKKVTESMAKTWCIRRNFISHEPVVERIMKEWPAYRQIEQEYADFRRLTDVNLSTAFISNIDNMLPTDGEYSQDHKRNSLMKNLQAQLHSTIVHKFGSDCEEEAVVSIKEPIYIAEILLDENPDDFDYYIVIENGIVHECKHMYQAFMAVFAFIWVLNLQYPVPQQHILEFIQKVILNIDSGVISTKVRNAQRRLQMS